MTIPAVGDQFFWAERVDYLGAGPRPLCLWNLTVTSFMATIQQCLTQEIREAAWWFGKEEWQKDGAHIAVCQFHKNVLMQRPDDLKCSLQPDRIAVLCLSSGFTCTGYDNGNGENQGQKIQNQEYFQTPENSFSPETQIISGIGLMAPLSQVSGKGCSGKDVKTFITWKTGFTLRTVLLKELLEKFPNGNPTLWKEAGLRMGMTSQPETPSQAFASGLDHREEDYSQGRVAGTGWTIGEMRNWASDIPSGE
ncbi:hypothetical protein B0I35DRAFT_410407 [Stachybotrys elegans]|uniref:Uncharacterized protein n=1 Tax=Stachybotrys elegans TaxID=80388 RepID=A0A8K0WQ68_9HYPO|nr:hypothetical protein B0I35DRAFT_410407 [Stachybotrys elegans]